jgi:putative transcriptional regulator
MTLDEILTKPSRMDHAKVAATTEADIASHMIEDGEDPESPLRDENIVSPAAIRKNLGMSQSVFADTLGIPVATLRNWEQNRVMMDASTIALMRIIAHEPDAAIRALRRKQVARLKPAAASHPETA